MKLYHFNIFNNYIGIYIAGVLLVNLLIAIISSVYEQMSTVVDSSHRAVLIQYYNTYKWDEKFGYLIFLSSPFNKSWIYTFDKASIRFKNKFKTLKKWLVKKNWHKIYFL